MTPTAAKSLFASPQSPNGSNLHFDTFNEVGSTIPSAPGKDVDVDYSDILAADDSEVSGTSTRSVSQSQVQTDLVPKVMKKSSMVAQFFTTIVLKSCISCREWNPTCNNTVRACYVFEKVEVGLRDRKLYPLPPDVSQNDLLKNSFFHELGSQCEDNFKTFCVDKEFPLDEFMIKRGDSLYVNKFSDAKKEIVNRALPKFFSILNKNTGFGTKSG